MVKYIRRFFIYIETDNSDLHSMCCELMDSEEYLIAEAAGLMFFELVGYGLYGQ